jgi:hypothetical protein
MKDYWHIAVFGGWVLVVAGVFAMVHHLYELMS